MRKLIVMLMLVIAVVAVLCTAPIATVSAQGNGTYVVQSGDSLFSIAARFNVSVSELATINRIYDVNNVPVGLVLILPAQLPSSPSNPVGQPTTAPAQPNRGGGGQPNQPTNPVTNPVVISNLAPGTTITRTVKVTLYVVKSGDSLDTIAVRFRTTTAAIMAANSLANPDRIFVGQQLTIPQPAVQVGRRTVTGRVYIVQAGDNLFSIAAKFKRDVYALARANNLLNLNAIYVGQALSIP